MNQFKLKMRTADVKEQADFYEDSKGNSLKATYKKDSSGCINILNVQYYMSLLGKIHEWTGSREYILEKTNHSETQNFSVGAIYANDLKSEILPKGSTALYKQLEEMREGGE
jgi:hypothetical protein